MTIEEVIKYCEEVAEELNEKACDLYENEDYENAKDCIWGAKEHRQLAEWLKELKAYRGILANADRIIESEYGCVIIEGYKDVIDQMNEVYSEVNADEDSD